MSFERRSAIRSRAAASLHSARQVAHDTLRATLTFWVLRQDRGSYVQQGAHDVSTEISGNWRSRLCL